LQLIWADGGYAGKLVNWAKESCQWILEIVKRNKDYESLTQTSETMIYATMVNIMIRRLARNNQAFRS
jgi:putative transposase